jgi:hypothetical protein
MSVLPDTYRDLVLCTPRLMAADIIWEMEQGSGYTATINGLRVAEHPQPVNGPYVLADLRFTGPGPFSFTLGMSASVTSYIVTTWTRTAITPRVLHCT